MFLKEFYGVNEDRLPMKVEKLLRTRFRVHAASTATGKDNSNVHNEEKEFLSVSCVQI